MSNPEPEDPDSGHADGAPNTSEAVPANDPHKVEKLTKAGREGIDPDEGSD